jgi:propionate catabolism operon transcriptional regulator
LIFGYQEFSRLVTRSIGNFQSLAEFKIVDIIVGSSTDVFKHIENFKPDVVISAGSNSAHLKLLLDIPVISLEVTEGDIVLAVSKAAKISDDLLLICFEKPKSILPHLEKSLGVTVTCHSYDTPEEARELFYLATNKSSKVVIGASFVCGLATNEGVKSFLYYSHESCRNTIKKAIEVGNNFSQNKNSQALYHWLLSKSLSPTIIVSDKNKLVRINESANREFELSDLSNDEVLDLLQENLTSGMYCHNGNDWKYSQDTLKLPGRCDLVVYQFFKINKESLVPDKINLSQGEFIYESEVMIRMMDKVKRFSHSPSNVLIYGESGTGKELVARTIHQSSPYAKGNFVAINCGSIPVELFEGELFGHVDGAYTGAKRGGRKGLIENATNGVLFLDEVSDLTLGQQAKLLRFIQERTIRPLGSNKELSIDLKIVAASNVSLANMVAEKKFREDLFFRLNVFTIELPPLRVRAGDVEAIALVKLKYFFSFYKLELDINKILNQLLPTLNNYPWPGNIRELENVIERLTAHLKNDSDEQYLEQIMRDIAPELYTNSNISNGHISEGNIQQIELNMIVDAMAKFDNDKHQVADSLGISYTTLWRRLKQLGQ